MRELLKEARDILGDAYYDGVEPLSDGTRAMIAKVIKRIDAALSAPEPDAMEIVDKLDHIINDNQGIRAGFDHNAAAALIEQQSRRVPRAMLADIYCLGWTDSRKNRISEDHSAIAAKYGVEVEG